MPGEAQDPVQLRAPTWEPGSREHVMAVYGSLAGLWEKMAMNTEALFLIKMQFVISETFKIAVPVVHFLLDSGWLFSGLTSAYIPCILFCP